MGFLYKDPKLATFVTKRIFVTSLKKAAASFFFLVYVIVCYVIHEQGGDVEMGGCILLWKYYLRYHVSIMMCYNRANFRFPIKQKLTAAPIRFVYKCIINFKNMYMFLCWGILCFSWKKREKYLPPVVSWSDKSMPAVTFSCWS